MRTRIITFLSAVLLMLGILSVAQPAAAAPAQPYAVSSCQIFGDFKYCVQTKGVVQRNESASGNTTYSPTDDDATRPRSGMNSSMKDVPVST